MAHANEKATSELPHYEVESYLQYQGRKFTRRFDPNCYLQLTYTLDSHDVAEGRGDYFEVLRSLRHRTLVVGINSDVLYPFRLQQELARHMPRATLHHIDSPHGHDAFLIEIEGLNRTIAGWRRGGGGVGRGVGQAAAADGDDDDDDESLDFPSSSPAPTYGVVDADFISAVQGVIAASAADAARGGQPRVLHSPEDVAPYAGDMGHHSRASPDLVVLPLTTEETAAVVRLCYARRIPVVTRGAGTGLEGGCIPYSGGVVLDTSLMKTKRLVPGEQLAVVGAGVLKNELNAFLAPHGMLFGPDPSSNPTIGGMASTGGSGMSTLKYGTSKENVRSMVVVTPSGRVIRTRQAVRKSSTGYEINALYLGAEGTLGVITELTVRLFPRPKVRCGAVIVFPDVKSAADTVVAAVNANLGTLLRCELMNDEVGRPFWFVHERVESGVLMFGAPK